MSRSMFGWSLPPGVTNQMIEEAQGLEQPCEVCGLWADDCQCPICPTCKVQGKQACWNDPAHLEQFQDADGAKFYAALTIYRNELEEMFYYTRDTLLVSVSNAIAERAVVNGGVEHVMIQRDMVSLTDEQQAVYLEQGRLVL